MNMKKLTLYIISSFFLLGCSDDFFDTRPTEKYIEDTFWENKENALAALNGCYTVLRDLNLYGGMGLMAFETLTPNAYNQSNNEGFNVIAQGNHDAANSTIINNRYNRNYRGIGRVNTLLANIDKINMEESLKSRIKGEAKFLRSLYYFDLANYYGGVPLITAAPDIEAHSNLPRNTKEEVIKQILLDLDEASESLPLKYAATDQGRATKGAALALKARVLLYEGRWSEAAAAAKAVMDLNQYGLFPNYRGVFMVENEGNQEVIFDVQFKTPELANDFDNTLDLFNKIAPLPDLVHAYRMIDGKSEAESPLYDPSNPYKNKDPRFYATIIYPGAMFKGKIVKENDYPRTGYGQKKYTVYKDDEAPKQLVSIGRSELNYILLRYADVLLMYAEALNEEVGPNTSIYAALNQIRGRAGMPEVGPGHSKEELRAVIRQERRIELAGEGLYYNDIRRWKIAENIMNGPIYNFKNQRLEDRSFNPTRDYIWPIPSQAIEQNPALAQNPGFGK
jgi:starch-binding outer membrane protein, SusD/RagB family